MAKGKKLNGMLRAFIEKQKMFFVATADQTGRVNVSPKGMDTLRIENDNRILWLNLSGSGNETAAHVRATGRMTLMFCAFEGPANILRLFGTGEIVNPHHAEWDEMLGLFPGFERARGIFKVKLKRIQDSCGWGVPFYEFKGERDQLSRYVDNKSTEEWIESRYEKNGESIDGLKGLVRETS